MRPAQPALTLATLIRRFLAWCRKWRSKGTAREYRRHLHRFLDATGNVTVQDVRKVDVLEWAKTWHEMQAVQRLFNWAVFDAELMERAPFRRLKLPPLGKRKRIIDRPLVARLMRRASPAFRAFLIALRETLARPQEVRKFDWANVVCPGSNALNRDDVESGRACLVLDDFKGKARRKEQDEQRVVIITPRLGRLLWRLFSRRRRAAGAIFRNHRGRRWSNNAVRLRMRWLRRKLNLKRDHRGEHVVAYTLRHTMATNAAANGVRDRILAEILGHTTPRTTWRYQHLQIEHLQAAMETIHKRKGKGQPNKPGEPN